MKKEFEVQRVLHDGKNHIKYVECGFADPIPKPIFYYDITVDELIHDQQRQGGNTP